MTILFQLLIIRIIIYYLIFIEKETLKNNFKIKKVKYLKYQI